MKVVAKKTTVNFVRDGAYQGEQNPSEISRKIYPICGRQIGPKSKRSEGPLIEAHNPCEPKLCKYVGDELPELVPVIYGVSYGLQ